MPKSVDGLVRVTAGQLRASFHPNDTLVYLYVIEGGSHKKEKRIQWPVHEAIAFMTKRSAGHKLHYCCMRIDRTSIEEGWKAHEKLH